MKISASKVKSVCSESEIALVRASRKGAIEKLGHAELKRLESQARKLLDKSRDLGRSQSRARSRKVGFGETDANTKVRKQIFRDALASFEAQRATLEVTLPTAAPAKSKTKKQRSAEHRSKRAAVRKGMTAAEDLLNTDGRKKQPSKTAAARKSAQQSASASAPTTTASQGKAVPVANLKTKPTPSAKHAAKTTSVDPAKQRAAMASAKQSRVARSGLTTRTLGHITARGRRSQARRDAKN